MDHTEQRVVTILLILHQLRVYMKRNIPIFHPNWMRMDNQMRNWIVIHLPDPLELGLVPVQQLRFLREIQYFSRYKVRLKNGINEFWNWNRRMRHFASWWLRFKNQGNVW